MEEQVKVPRIGRLAVALVLFAWVGAAGHVAAAQQPAAAGQAAAPAMDDATHGELLVMQRCALCHLSPDGWRKSGLLKPIGPPLSLANATPERETAVRERIRMGSTNMPAFRYALDARQMDLIVAYLRTVK